MYSYSVLCTVLTLNPLIPFMYNLSFCALCFVVIVSNTVIHECMYSGTPD